MSTLPPSDWSHEIVLINGVTVTVKVAHVRLCHSRMLFVPAYPRETHEMVFDVHDRAFSFFKGTCMRGIYVSEQGELLLKERHSLTKHDRHIATRLWTKDVVARATHEQERAEKLVRDARSLQGRSGSEAPSPSRGGSDYYRHDLLNRATATVAAHHWRGWSA